MGFQASIASSRRRRYPVFPHFGVAAVRPVAQKDGAFILSLPLRGTSESRVSASITLNANAADLTMYYAYPMTFGPAIFTDISPGSAGFSGGWDGAHGDYGSTMGPIIVPVLIMGVPIDFYLYETDWANLGLVDWRVD